MSVVVFFVAVFSPLNLICFPVCTWSCWNTSQTAWLKLKEVNVHPSRSHSRAMSDKAMTKACMILTIACTLSFWLSLFSTLVWSALFIIRAVSTSTWDDYDTMEWDPWVILPTFVSRILLILACALLFLTSFVRFHLTFLRTKYRLSDSSLLMFKLCFIVALMSGIIAILIFRQSPVIALGLMITAIALYFSVSVFLGWKLSSNTIAIAQRLQSEHEDHDQIVSMSDPSGDGTSDSSTSDRVSDLLDVSLKLAILTSVALSSTVISGLSFMSAAFTRNDIIRCLGLISLPLDTTINVICLQCFMAKYICLYRSLFGRIHNKLKNYL